MSRHATTAALAFGLVLVVAAPALAGTVSYQDGVFRYRDDPGFGAAIHISSVRPAEAHGTSGRLSGLVLGPSHGPPPNAGPGCRLVIGPSDNFVCTLTTPGLPRYRLSLGDGTDDASVQPRLRGVIYSGPGSDFVNGSWRVFGGTGPDNLTGPRVWGGPGDDQLVGSPERRLSILRGGPGGDSFNLGLSGPGWAYGGRGRDDFLPSPFRDMIVGGPGADEIDFLAHRADTSVDVFRIRDGGRDDVFCEGLSVRLDVFFADRSDVFELCRDERVLFTGWPRIFR